VLSEIVITPVAPDITFALLVFNTYNLKQLL